MMKFESGYTVEMVFDGSKLGIKPYLVEVLPNEELLLLDSANSNIYRISASLSLYTRPKLVGGSPKGYSGHVDGKPREARMNQLKGLTVDDRGNIYIADTMNMAIRKISVAGKCFIFILFKHLLCNIKISFSLGVITKTFQCWKMCLKADNFFFEDDEVVAPFGLPLFIYPSSFEYFMSQSSI
ncbi:hypothetical protein F2P56_024762 [Juglans regia]|uniref:Uncharacterized protein n=1 Tax=Juglans regia TaxID=51240 RepID=A0A833UI26_JUGRE|nr:hypothetical protein F2P56_024762 [Juglans regia]